MMPETAAPTQDGGAQPDGDGWEAGAFDRWLAAQKITDEPRPSIIADIVGHPRGMPSVEELDYMNPDLSDDSIRRHLKELADVGVVIETEIPKGERLRDFPRKFYEISDDARELFDENGWFPEGAWKRQYEAVSKTDRIRDLEEMPRPK